MVERGECQLDVWLWNFYWIQICFFSLVILSSIILELFGPTILQYTAKVELDVLYMYSLILQNPLYAAAQNGHTAVVEILLKAGASVNKVSH